MRGDLTQILELPLTPDGKLDLAVFNTQFRQLQEKLYALEGRTQASQIRDDLQVLGGVNAIGGLHGASLSAGAVDLTPIDPSLSPTLETALKPSSLVYTSPVGHTADILSASNPFTFASRDEFNGSGTASGSVGDLGWQVSVGTVSLGSATQGHPGFVVLDSGAGAAVARLQLQAVFPADLGYLAAIVRTDAADITNANYAFGFTTSNPAAGVEVATGAYFSYVAATSGFWRTYTADGSTTTVNTTSTAVAANSWYLLEIVYKINSATDQTIDFYINRTRAFRHTTSAPITSAVPIFIAQATTAAAKTLAPSRFIMQGRIPLSAKVWT